MSDIVNDRAHHRFELMVDGHLAISYYKLEGNVVSFIHTEVPPGAWRQGRRLKTR